MACIAARSTHDFFDPTAFFLASRLVADGLYDRIEDSWLDQATALEFLRGMFYDNPVNLFRLVEAPKHSEVVSGRTT